MNGQYRPKPSHGWLWWLAIAAVTGVGAVPVLVLPGEEPIPVWVVVIMWGVVGLAGYFVLIAAVYPTMSYELGESELVARYGPLLTYRIPYSTITGVHVEDLRWSAWSSMSMPGLALYSVVYAKRGSIKMCSTRATRGVLVLETTAGPYGISPAEEDRFVADLKARMRTAGQA